MSSYCKAGSFNSRSGTGSQSITGLGFQPKGLMIIGMVIDPSLSWERHRYTSIGFTDGTFQACGACAETDNDIPGAGTAIIEHGVILAINIPSATLQIATLTSFDADGFTLNWTTNNVSPTLGYFFYMAFGGSSVQCKAQKFAGPNGVASQSVTGIGFKPTGLFTSYDIVNDGFAGFSNLGWSDGTDDGSTYSNSINSSTTSFTIETNNSPLIDSRHT